MFADPHRDDAVDPILHADRGGGEGPDDLGAPIDDGSDDGAKRCPSCGDTFIPTATRCPDCDVELTSGDEPVTYTFLQGDSEAVEALRRLMEESAVPFELDDDELAVPGTHAVAADRVLDHLDRMLGIALDHGGEVEVLELYDWEDHELDLLEAHLRVARVPHTWDDDGFLLVAPDAVEEAEVVIDRVAHPHALEPDLDVGPVASPELLSDLFLAADAVRREPWNLQKVGELGRLAEAAEGAAPFGVDQNTWNLAVTAAGDAVAAADDGDGDEDEVRAQADRARALLRPLV